MRQKTKSNLDFGRTRNFKGIQADIGLHSVQSVDSPVFQNILKPFLLTSITDNSCIFPKWLLFKSEIWKCQNAGLPTLCTERGPISAGMPEISST